MRSLNALLLALLLIAGCGPAPTDTAAITTTGGGEHLQPRQATKIYLPNIVEDRTQTAAATPNGQTWRTYNHEPWGITFDYPADWRVDVPDLEARVGLPEGTPDLVCLPDYREIPDTKTTDCAYTIGYTNTTDILLATTYGYQVTLVPPENSVGTRDILISLESLTLAPGMTLREWIRINIQYELWDHEGNWENYEPNLVPFPREVRPNADEIWMELAEKGSRQGIATIYISTDKLVYAVRFRPADPALQEVAEQFVASLKFDLARQRELEALPWYSHDITYLQTLIDESPIAP